MRVKCVFNSGEMLLINKRCLGETNDTDYSCLELGDEYTVYGLMFFNSRVDYLICPFNSNPVWIPADLCEVKIATLPSDWSICITDLNSDYKVLYDAFNIQSIIGYSELVTSYSHYVGLIEREPDELKIFFVEKQKIDNDRFAY